MVLLHTYGFHGNGYFVILNTQKGAREGYKVQGQGLKVTGHQVQIGFKASVRFSWGIFYIHVSHI